MDDFLGKATQPKNISSLIEDLKRIEKEHGDLPLCIASPNYMASLHEGEIKLKIVKDIDYDIQLNLTSSSYLSITIEK